MTHSKTSLIQISRRINGMEFYASAGGGTTNTIAGALARRAGVPFVDAVRLLNAKEEAGEICFSCPPQHWDFEYAWSRILEDSEAAIALIAA